MTIPVDIQEHMHTHSSNINREIFVKYPRENDQLKFSRLDVSIIE